MSGVGLNPEQYQHRKTGVGPISKHPSTMPRPALIVFSKVRGLYACGEYMHTG